MYFRTRLVYSKVLAKIDRNIYILQNIVMSRNAPWCSTWTSGKNVLLNLIRMDKIVVFIDGGYLSKLTKDIFTTSNGYPKKVDFSKFSSNLSSQCNGELLRTYYYDCPAFVSQNPNPEEREKQKRTDSFFYNLKRLDKFDVRLGKLNRYFNAEGEIDFEQKGVDVLLAIDALRLAIKGKIDKAIFVTGDSDFVPVIQAIKDEGVGTILFYHDSSVHRNILDCCDSKHPITEELINNSLM